MLNFSDVLDLPTAKRQDVIRQAAGILQRNKNDVNALMLGAAAHMGERNTNPAREMLERAHKLKKSDPAILHWLTKFYKETNDHKKARLSAMKLCAVQPKIAEHQVLLAEVMVAAGETKNAVFAYEKAQSLGDESPEIDALIGDAWRAMGEMDKAKHAFEIAFEKDQNNTRALYGLANTGKLDSNDAEKLVSNIVLALKAKENQGPVDQANLNYAAAKVLVDIEEIDRGFAFYNEANAAVNPAAAADFAKELSDSPTAYLKEFENNKSAYNANFLASRNEFGSKSNKPIFIIGMPRSGTTLVESICAAHSRVSAADELPYLETLASQLGAQVAPSIQYGKNISSMQNQHALNYANSYLEYTKEIVGNAAHFTDKLPHNFFQVGLIQLLFPNAKIIHCKRHPIDNCLSLYTNSMTTAHNFYKSDLKTLGLYYREYLSLMKHWEEVLPGKLHHVYYEDVVANSELNSRNIVDYLGLKWEDRVLKRETSQNSVKTLSAWQVRQPIYTSSAGKWRKFEKHLGPLIDALGDCVAEYEEELQTLQSAGD